MTNVHPIKPRFNTLPTDKDLQRLPLARTTEYQLSPKEIKQTRVRCYALNKDNTIFKIRTILVGDILTLLRIRI